MSELEDAIVQARYEVYRWTATDSVAESEQMKAALARLERLVRLDEHESGHCAFTQPCARGLELKQQIAEAVR